MSGGRINADQITDNVADPMATVYGELPKADKITGVVNCAK